jgi:hypothetical protein
VGVSRSARLTRIFRAGNLSRRSMAVHIAALNYPTRRSAAAYTSLGVQSAAHL